MNSFHHLHKVAALVSLDKIDEARRAIDSVSLEEISRKNGYVAMYYIHVSFFNILDNDFETAQKNMDVIQELKLPEKHKKICAEGMKRNHAEIMRKQGNLPESRKLYNELMKRNKMDKRYYLNCAFALAQIDMKEQKYDDAKVAFKKIADEGNRLYIVHLARQELEKLSSFEI